MTRIRQEIRHAVAAAIVLSITVAVPLLTPPALAASALAGNTSIDISVTPIAGFRARYPAERQFGDLDWLGGLVLSSADPRFGGFSGLLSLDDGARILAVSDRGNWFAARLTQGPTGEPLGIEAAMMAPLLNERGEALAGQHSGDAEALTITRGGGAPQILVSFEQLHRVLGWMLSPSIPETRAGRVATPPGIAKLSGNKGLEGLAASAVNGALRGALVAIAERDPGGGETIPGWIFGTGGTQRFKLVRRDDYDVTDAAFLPGGDLLVLERRFNLRYGLGMRLRRIAENDLLHSGTIDGTVVMEADLRHQIDNMEGLAVHQGTDGATIVTLISDDNQSVLQRTVLLRFRLRDSGKTAPAAPRRKP